MAWTDALQEILQRYSGAGAGTAAAPADPHGDYQKVAKAAPTDVVAGGLSQAFRSDQTPPFPQMLANLFGQSDPNQRAGVLNRLRNALEPGAASAGGAVTPQQASRRCKVRAVVASWRATASMLISPPAQALDVPAPAHRWWGEPWRGRPPLAVPATFPTRAPGA